MSELLNIYTSFTAGLNLPLVRTQEAMRERAEHDPYTSRHYCYLNRDDSGTANAYILCNTKDGDDGKLLNVRELAWTSPEGLRDMFGLLGALAPEFESMKWDAPDGVVMPDFFGDGFEIKTERPAYGMNRIVNVKRALELINAPGTSGRVSVYVKDDTLICNTGIYTIEWEAGKVTNVEESGKPDLETDIHTLTQLVTGFLTPDQAMLKQKIKVYANEDRLRELFVRKDLYIADFF
jgi:predicted acetyltransferase